MAKKNKILKIPSKEKIKGFDTDKRIREIIHANQFYQHEFKGNKCSCGYDAEDHEGYY